MELSKKYGLEIMCIMGKKKRTGQDHCDVPRQLDGKQQSIINIVDERWKLTIHPEVSQRFKHRRQSY
jgi:hypothetical protein